MCHEGIIEATSCSDLAGSEETSLSGKLLWAETLRAFLEQRSLCDV